MGVRKLPPHDWREWRRLRAWELNEKGWGVREIAEALDVSPSAVSEWLKAARQHGPQALLARARPGAPAKLTPEQRRQIADFLWHGPEAYGFRGEVWTCGRVAKVLEEEFQVTYDKGHVSRLLKRLGWTSQIPITRAVQRDVTVRCVHALTPSVSCRGGLIPCNPQRRIRHGSTGRSGTCREVA